MASLISTKSPMEKTFVLLAICLAAAAMPLTFTGTAVALPSIGRALGGSPVALNWVTNAFMLTFGGSLMAAGAIADGFGRRRAFLIGTAAFALASLGLCVAPDIVCFDILRAVLGLASAAAFSSGMAALAQEFDGPDRLRVFSFVGTSFGVGLAFGPIASGLMIDAFGWRTIFLLTASLAAAAFGLGAFCLSESRDPDAKGLDWPGAISFTAALTSLTYGVLEAPESGWSNPLVIALLVASALLFAAFVVIEGHVRRPMLDLTLFRYPRFVGLQLLAAAPAYAFVVLLVLLPVRFIGVEGLGEIEVGRLMICLSGPLLFLPVVAGYFTRWFSPSTICGAGLLIAAAGLFWLSLVPVGAAQTALVLPLMTIGIGISLPWGLMDGLAVSVVPRERAGMATGIFNTTRVAGEGIALAVVTAIQSGLTTSGLAVATGGPAADTVKAAQRLVTGDLSGALAALPEAGRAVLVQSYGSAFDTLLGVLAAVTLVTAGVVFLGLRRGSADEEDDGADVAILECSP